MFTECEIGFYNTSCSAKCGHCIDKSACAMENGYCPEGCENNYLYPRCKGSVYSQNKTSCLLIYELSNNSVVITDALKYLQSFSNHICILKEFLFFLQNVLITFMVSNVVFIVDAVNMEKHAIKIMEFVEKVVKPILRAQNAMVRTWKEKYIICNKVKFYYFDIRLLY